MSNVRDVKPRVKTVTLNDGVERELRFTLNAMAELEDKFGSIDAAFKALEDGSIKAARFILWAGLLHGDETLTEKQVGDLIDMSSLGIIMNGMTDAITEDMPAPSADGDAGLPNV